MTIIKLKTIYFLSFGGYRLTNDNPYIVADEAALNVLKPYIDNGYLEVKELEEKDNEKPVAEYEIPEFELSKAEEVYDGTVERVHEYTEEELKEKPRKELLELCKEKGITHKKNASAAELIKLVLENQ